MSAYIRCPKCGEDTFDVDTHDCDECGHSSYKETEALKARCAKLEAALQGMVNYYTDSQSEPSEESVMARANAALAEGEKGGG